MRNCGPPLSGLPLADAGRGLCATQPLHVEQLVDDFVRHPCACLNVLQICYGDQRLSNPCLTIFARARLASSLNRLGPRARHLAQRWAA